VEVDIESASQINTAFGFTGAVFVNHSATSRETGDCPEKPTIQKGTDYIDLNN
jgi:hypothetical protein